MPTVSRVAISRSSRPVPAGPRRISAGSSVSCAVMPGTRITAPITASATNHVMSSPHTTSTSGRAATESAARTSDATDTVRRSIRSTSSPETIPVAADAAVDTVARIPAARTSPVRSSTSKGITTLAMPLPSSDNPYELRYTIALCLMVRPHRRDSVGIHGTPGRRGTLNGDPGHGGGSSRGGARPRSSDSGDGDENGAARGSTLTC